MVRWAPDARGRLEVAAMELYAERGFDNTTVAEIAERAGLAERTFFRHFSDKREVLFHGAGGLQDFIVRHVDGAPDSLAPLETVVSAFAEAGSVIFEERRAFATQRQGIIAANTELRERELIKLAVMATALTEALRRRGVADPAASLAAETGITIFKVAFQRWTHESGQRTLSEIIGESLGELKLVAGG